MRGIPISRLRFKSLAAALVLVAAILLPVVPSQAAMILSEDFSDPSKLTYFAFENDGFKAVNGTFASANDTKYNAAYFGQYYEECVFEFNFRDDGGGEHIGGGSIRVGSARYDIEVASDATGADEKIRIWKGGPNKKASNTMKATGKGIPSIPLNTWVNVKIALTKSNVKVYIDDVLYVDYTDSFPYTSGGFGLRSQSSNLSYDNLKIYDLTDLVLQPKATATKAPTQGPTSATTPQATPVATSEATPTLTLEPTATGIPEVTATLTPEMTLEASPTTPMGESTPTPVPEDKGGTPVGVIIGIVVAALALGGGGILLLKRRK